MFEEKNTGDNLPAQIEILAEGEDAFKFLFIAKGGGSANKSCFYQATPSTLTHDRMIVFLKEKILTLDTAARPHNLAIVIGGASAEQTMKTVKLASTLYFDSVPTSGGADAQAFRDLAMEMEIHGLARTLGFGAQFGSKCHCHDVRVIRLPRRCPSAWASRAGPIVRRSLRSQGTAHSQKRLNTIPHFSCHMRIRKRSAAGSCKLTWMRR